MSRLRPPLQSLLRTARVFLRHRLCNRSVHPLCNRSIAVVNRSDHDLRPGSFDHRRRAAAQVRRLAGQGQVRPPFPRSVAHCPHRTPHSSLHRPLLLSLSPQSTAPTTHESVILHSRTFLKACPTSGVGIRPHPCTPAAGPRTPRTRLSIGRSCGPSLRRQHERVPMEIAMRAPTPASRLQRAAPGGGRIMVHTENMDCPPSRLP